MIAANRKLIVAVNYNQKTNVDIGGSNFLIAKNFSTNRRESNPVLCSVIEGNDDVPHGTILLVHHNRFIEGNPHHLGDNQYSLAYNSAIFAKLDEEGNAIGLCDNILVEHIFDNDSPLIPEHLKKPNLFKYRVVNDGFGYKKGDIVFCFDKANYEIVYVFKGNEYRVIKVIKNDIVGKILR